MERDTSVKNPSAGQAKEMMSRLQVPVVDMDKFKAGEIKLSLDFEDRLQYCFYWHPGL